MKYFDGLPLYRITINEDNTKEGMDAISLVDCPAVGDLFLKFNENEKILKFTADEDKHIITGVALSCNLPIYRVIDDVECYVIFDRETIEKLVLDYSRKNLFNSVNIQHNDENFVDGVYLIESYLLIEQGESPKEFPHVENGSYIVSFKITDNELWQQIKNSGNLNGFSIQGFFDLLPVEEEKDEFEELINEIFINELSVRELMDEKKQLDITTNDGKTFRGQIYSVGKTNGLRSAIIQDNKTLEWKNVFLKDIADLKNTNIEIMDWYTEEPTFKKIIDNENITVEKSAVVPQNTIDYAMDNNSVVMIMYDDNENPDGKAFRQCVIGSWGYTKRGNQCIRVYQYFGDSHSSPTGTGIWRLMLTKRIRDFQISTSHDSIIEAPPLFNPTDDRGMDGVIRIADFLYNQSLIVILWDCKVI
jgi:hypothetical protein